MHFYVTLTLNCNLQCRYCYGKCIDDFGHPFPFEVESAMPTSIAYELKDLARFIAKDPDPVIIFYGGEPTLALDSLGQIMDEIEAKSYIMQTNGLLLNKIDQKYAERIDAILVSIDGDEFLTDRYRGQGTYRNVLENLKEIRSRGFRGEVIARMTVNPQTEIRQAVNWLLYDADFHFDSVHWQLDAQFWQSDYSKENVRGWFEAYDKGVRDLVRDWISKMERTGEVPRIYPFVGIMESILAGRSMNLRCGAGWTEFNIQTDGNITPCPVMAGMKKYYLGNIWKTNPSDLANAIWVGHPCPTCSVFELCGGRCLYANVTKLWGQEGFDLVCGTVKNLISSLGNAKPEILSMISRGQIQAKDFEYPMFNSCEIVP